MVKHAPRYVERDPGNTLYKASSAKKDEMKRQRVLPFRDYLTIAKENKQIVIWDFNHVKMNQTVGSCSRSYDELIRGVKVRVHVC